MTGGLAALGLAALLALWTGLADAEQPPPAEGGLLLSTDRVHWQASLTEPLFDPAERWSPGESRSRIVYVRNDGAAPHRLQVSSEILGATEARWADVSTRPEAESALQPGAVRRVEVRATVDALAEDHAMTRQLDVAVDLGPTARRHTSSPTAHRPPATGLDRAGAAGAGGLLVLLAIGVARRPRRES